MPHATASTISLLQRSRLENSEPASHVLHGDSVKAVYSSHVALQVFVCNLQGETKQKHHGLLASSRWPTELPQPHSLRVSTDPRAPALGLCCSPRLPCDKPALLPGFFFLLPCDLTNLARMWAIRYRVEWGERSREGVCFFFAKRDDEPLSLGCVLVWGFISFQTPSKRVM